MPLRDPGQRSLRRYLLISVPRSSLDPGREFWGILFPLSEQSAFQVTTAKIAGRNEWDNTGHIDFYFEQYSGQHQNDMGPFWPVTRIPVCPGALKWWNRRSSSR
jgi:hypothetical protein